MCSFLKKQVQNKDMILGFGQFGSAGHTGLIAIFFAGIFTKCGCTLNAQTPD